MHFNPHRPNKKTRQGFREWIRHNPGKSFIGERESSGNTVYITIATQEYSEQLTAY